MKIFKKFGKAKATDVASSDAEETSHQSSLPDRGNRLRRQSAAHRVNAVASNQPNPERSYRNPQSDLSTTGTTSAPYERPVSTRIVATPSLVNSRSSEARPAAQRGTGYRHTFYASSPANPSTREVAALAVRGDDTLISQPTFGNANRPSGPPSSTIQPENRRVTSTPARAINPSPQPGVLNTTRPYFTPSVADSSRSETSSTRTSTNVDRPAPQGGGLGGMFFAPSVISSNGRVSTLSGGPSASTTTPKTRLSVGTQDDASTILAPNRDQSAVGRLLPASRVKNPARHDVVILASSIQSTSGGHAGGHVTDTVCRYPSFIIGSGATFVARKVRVPCECVESGFVVVKTPKISTTPGGSEKDWGTHLKRILFELRALRHEQLMHQENIVRLEGVTWMDDLHDLERKWPALVLEYADGGSLSDVLVEEKLTVSTKLRICLDIANGLSALHSCGIVHSDVKCENILMFRDKGRDYTAKIGDFGCSIAENSGGAYLGGGSPPWTAPEWREWISAENLPKTDIYSFGLLVWRVVTDRFDPWENILGTKTASQPAARKERIEALKNGSDDLLHLLESDVISSRLPEKERNVVVETLRRTIKHDPKKRNLREPIVLLSAAVPYIPTQKKGENASFDMGDMCREIWKSMKEMIPGEFTEPMIWALCSKISSSVNISTLEMRKLKAQNGNKVDEKYFELFTQLATQKNNSRGTKGKRRVDEMRVLPNEDDDDVSTKNNLSPELAARELSCFSTSHLMMLPPILRKQIEESLIRAANGGGQDAALFLVAYYLNIAFDPNAACRWLVRAAELRSSSAMYLCHRIHKALGIPVPENLKDQIENWLYTGTCWGSKIAFQDLRVVKPSLAHAAGFILQKQGSYNGDIPFREAALAGPFNLGFDSPRALSEKIRRDGRHVNDIVIAGENQDRLLHWAAGTGNADAIDVLVQEHGADINIRNAKGETPFLAAMRSGSGQTMAKLIGLKADPTIASNSGQVPLHWLWGLEGSASHVNSLGQEVQQLKMLALGMCGGDRRVLNSVADAVTARINGFKEEKHVRRLQTHIFSDLPAGTPLHWAVQRRCLAAVKALLEAGASPETDSAGAVAPSGIPESQSVWHLAAAMHDNDILTLFVDNLKAKSPKATMAELSEQIPRGVLAATIDGCASQSYENGLFARLARHGELYQERTRRIFDLLWDLGLHDLDKSFSTGKVTPLFLAVQTGHIDVVKALLESNYRNDLEVRCGAGFTPLQESINRRADDIYFLLRLRGANIHAKWGMNGGSHGVLALCAQAGHHNTAVAADLIKAGVPIRSPSPDILSPLVLAVHGGHFKLARFFLDKGADINELQDHRVRMLSFATLAKPTTVLGLCLKTSSTSNLLPITWLAQLQKQGAFAPPLSPMVSPSIGGLNVYHEICMVEEHGRDDEMMEKIFQLLWGMFPDKRLLNAFFYISENVGDVSPLILAVEFSNSQLVSLLLKEGADPKLKNCIGMSPVDMAVRFASEFERDVRSGTISAKVGLDKTTSVPKMLENRRRVRNLLLAAANSRGSSDIVSSMGALGVTSKE